MPNLNERSYLWILASILGGLLIITVAVMALRPVESASDPRAEMPSRLTHLDHSKLIEGPLESGPAVTKACISCHETSAHEVAGTSHWTWQREAPTSRGQVEPVLIGKKTQMNNFCIGIEGNWQKCTTCHAGYGWLAFQGASRQATV